MAKKSKIFLSHSSKDRNYVDSLILEAQNFKDIELWISSNDKIELGAEFITEIKNAIDESSGAIILISNNLLNSEFIQEHELPELINRKKNDSQYILVPVLIEDCDWENNQNLEGMQLLNTKSTNLKSLTGTQYSLLVKQIFQSITKNLKEKVIDKKEAKKIKRNKTLRRIAIFSIISLIGFLSANNIFGPTGTDLIESEFASLPEDQKKEVVKILTGEDSDLAENSILKALYPISCSATSTLSSEFSCENLFLDNFTFNGWKDDNNKCLEQELTFTFDQEYYIEFMTLENPILDDDFVKYHNRLFYLKQLSL